MNGNDKGNGDSFSLLSEKSHLFAVRQSSECTHDSKHYILKLDLVSCVAWFVMSPTTFFISTIEIPATKTVKKLIKN